VLRFLFSRRVLGLTAALIVLGAAFSALAVWQWDRAHSRVVDPASLAAVPLDRVSAPGTAAVPGAAIGRAVTATGTYAGQRTYAVRIDGAGGPSTWVMTPLRLSDGSVIPIVHGDVVSIAAARAVVVPRGSVVVTGRLQPSQDAGAAPPTASGSTPGVLDGISTSELAGLVAGEIRPGYVVAATEKPLVVGVQPLPADALVRVPRGVRLQNVLYTVQWSLFAAFVIFVYWRLMRDAWRERRMGSMGGGAVDRYDADGTLTADVTAKGTNA
jgi:cytochrome oxidase assembly protein ShyY1